MIIRYGGGNAGIKEYLEQGRKVDRHFSRDELDKRIPIEGDLVVSQAVIDSIPDKGQERYLHITMSFNEPDITEDKIKEVFQQYKAELMHAYGEDEHAIYAEIHWPKVKEAYNHNTGEMEQRFPHVHMVVPKQNMLTGKFLNPPGIHSQNVKYLDAIQEKLNRENGLSSPRENPRIGSNHYEAALGKYKEKEFETKNGEMKRSIYDSMVSRDIRSIPDFKNMLSEYGEVKVRNEGKENQYFAVKAPGDQKFTNLKANIFNREYIENRNLVVDPITDAQVARRIETWREIQSKEIKHISNASAKTKETYRNLSLPERREFLAERERNYEQRYRAEQGAGVEERRISGLQSRGYQPSNFELAGSIEAKRAGNLHELRESSVDYFDSERESAAGLLLHGAKDNDLQHLQSGRDSGLRHNLYDRSGEGGGRVTQLDDLSQRSSVIGHLIAAHEDKEAQESDLQRFAKIRKELDPAHLLAYAQIKYGINPEDHRITKARDGSPRISAGKYNYNVSDFLTKHVGLEWREASGVLTELYEKQQAGIVSRPKARSEHAADWKRFREEVYPQNIKTYAELKNEIKSSKALGMKAINAEYFARRKSITNDPTLTREERHYFRSVVIMEKLQKIEALQQEIRSQNELKSRVKYPYSTLFYDFATKNEEMNMKVLDKLKERYMPPAQEGENSISGSRLLTPQTMPSGEEAVKRAKLVAELRKQEKEFTEAKIKVADLRPKPLTSGGVAFVHKDDGHPVFVNHPDRLEMSRNTEKEEVGVALIFAAERFGNPLEIKGTPEFKEQIIAVAAERNMDITFTDELMNKALEAKRIELGMEPLQSNSITAPGELELDKNLPREQAIDKALLESKIVELQAINEAHAKQPAPEAEATINRQILADAEHRHEELQSGFIDQGGIEQVAKEDLEAFAYLEGKPEQQELARGIGAAMQNQDYRAYMELNGPQELSLTIDASQAIAAQQPGMEAEKQAAEPTVTELEQQAQAAQIEQPEEVEAPAGDPGAWLASEVQEVTEGELANTFTALDQPQATGEVDLVEPESIHLPSEAQQEFAEEFDEVAARQHENDPLQSVHQGAPITTGQESPQLSAEQMASLSNRARNLETQAATLSAEIQQMRMAGHQGEEQIQEREKELAELRTERAGVLLEVLPQMKEQEMQAGASPERLERLDSAIQEAQDTLRQATEAERPEPLQFVHQGEPVTIDLERFQQRAPEAEQPQATEQPQAAERPEPLQFTHNGEPATIDLERFQQPELSQEWRQTISDLQEQGKLIDELLRGEENGMTTIDDLRATEIVYRLEDKEGEPRYSVEFREDGKLVAALTDLDRDELDNAVGDRNAKTIAEAGEREGKLSGERLANEHGISPQEQERRMFAKEERKEFDAGLMRDTFKQIEIADKVEELRAVSKSFEHQDSTGVDVAIRRGTLIEAEQRHEEVKSGTTESRIVEIAKQDAQAFKELEGKPEQQRLALSIGNMMQNEHYRSAMQHNAPEHLETTISAAQVIDSEMAAAEPERGTNKDMEM